MPNKEDKVDSTLVTEGGIQLPNTSNNTKHFSYKGKYSNALKGGLGFR